MKAADKKYINLRMFIVGIVFSLFFATIGAKAVYLQVYRGTWLSQKAANQYESIVKSSGKRGKIYDKNLREMAVSIDVTSVAAHPRQIDDAKKTAAVLAKALKIDRNALYRKLSSDKKFVWIKRQVTPKEGEAVRNLGVSGIDFIPEHNRFYPSKITAAQVLGFTDIDDQGIEGLEFYYDNYLQGTTSKSMILKDALGRGFDAEQKTFINNSGNNLILTIDRTTQYIAEKELSDTVETFSAKSGIAIVMVPKTGAILALAHVPFFNPNMVNKYNQEFWRNRVITDPFEPGSTMKIFSAAAAIESGSCSSNSIFYCENGAYKIGRNVVHDTHKHGWLSLQQIIKHSSNIGAIKFTETTGAEMLYKTLHGFGFGEKMGIDCPGESGGSLAPYQRWTKLDTGAISFGQGISVTALQLIAATCAIANEGILMKPHIVQAITDHNGRLIKSFMPKKIRQAVSSRTANTVKRLMQTVVTEGGTGVNAAIEGYSVCGKTGTAQKIDQKGEYAKDKFISSFVGFLPAENPEVAILIVIDEPRKSHYGGVVAAPAFRNIAEKIIDYMNISPRGKTKKMTVSLRGGTTG